MSEAKPDALVVEADTDLTKETDNSIQTLYYPFSMFRVSLKDDIVHLQRVLRPTGILIIQTYLAPTKKHRPIYLEALQSTLQGKRVRLYNEYEWGRWVKAAGFETMKHEKHDLLIEIEMMNIPIERVENAHVLLHQCPSDLLEFVEPTFPPQGRLGYVVRQLELILRKPNTP
jgi:hypothetical protein